MPVYSFRALNESGAQVEGRQPAQSRDAAFEKIRSRGLHPVSITQITERRSRARRGKIPRRLLSRALRQFATLLSAGVPLLETLDNLQRGAGDARLSERFEALAQHLRQGGRFSEGLRQRFPELPDYVFSLTELGETTGQMPKTLSDAAERMAADDALASELRSALTYPIILASVGGLIVFGMFVFVIPRFGALIDRSGADIPAMSRLVISTGVWMQAYWPIALGAIAGVVFCLRLVFATRAKQLSRIAARLPVTGPLLHRVDMETWSRTLGLALSNGSQLLPALDLAAGAVSSPALIDELQGVRRDVRAGANLDDAFATHVSRPESMLLDLMATGRKSGTLDRMLLFAADTYRGEITALTKRLTAVAEPAAILLISAIVGALVISIVLAMTSLYNFDL